MEKEYAAFDERMGATMEKKTMRDNALKNKRNATTGLADAERLLRVSVILTSSSPYPHLIPHLILTESSHSEHQVRRHDEHSV